MKTFSRWGASANEHAFARIALNMSAAILFLMLTGAGPLTTVSSIESDGTFEYSFRDKTRSLAYYTLENDDMKVFFSQGVMLGVENKKDKRRIAHTKFDFINGYLTPMDIFSSTSTCPCLFALYRPYCGKCGPDNSTLEVKGNRKRIIFTRSFPEDSRAVSIEYSLLSDKRIRVHLKSGFPERRYEVRLNFMGDDKFKAVTDWRAENVSSVIQEPDRDKTGMKLIETQYKKESLMEYDHHEDVFNERYPYYGSRRFLKINPKTVFLLYHEEEKIFSIHGATNGYFFYKNCSGEECFSFGYKFPYTGGTLQIKDDFEIVLKMEY